MTGPRSRWSIPPDSALLRYDEVWAAAGLPDAVFPIAPADLVRLSRATEADVRV